MCCHCSATCGCQWLQPILHLLDGGVDINGITVKGESALHVSARQGRAQVVVALLALRAEPLRSASHRGWTPLHEAAKSGRTQVCRILLDSALADGGKDMSGCSVSDSCGDHGSQVNAAVARLACAATVDTGATPLWEAVARGSVGVVRMLLGCRADPSARLEDGTTLLMGAAERGDLEICRALLQAACHVCCGGTRTAPSRTAHCAGRCEVWYHWPIKNASGKSAMDLARSSYTEAKFHGTRKQCVETSDLVLLLEKHGVR